MIKYMAKDNVSNAILTFAQTRVSHVRLPVSDISFHNESDVRNQFSESDKAFPAGLLNS
jgi:hypothetical protein